MNTRSKAQSAGTSLHVPAEPTMQFAGFLLTVAERSPIQLLKCTVKVKELCANGSASAM
jgi:hypothetical protein